MHRLQPAREHLQQVLKRRDLAHAVANCKARLRHGWLVNSTFGRQTLRSVELAINKCRVEDQLRPGISDLSRAKTRPAETAYSSYDFQAGVDELSRPAGISIKESEGENSDRQADNNSALRNMTAQASLGPALRIIYPNDEGVFMYTKRVGNALVLSDVQAYLDLYAVEAGA